MKFWPFPLMRNYSENCELTELFLRFSSSKRLQVVSQGQFEIVVSCEHGVLKFWSANAYYAWGKSGEFVSTEGEVTKWFGEMPSRYAVRKMRIATDLKPIKFTLVKP